jgi:hypothetical protein
MAITIDEYATVQRYTRTAQEMALFFAKAGESKISGLFLKAALATSKLKPTKESPKPAAESPAQIAQEFQPQIPFKKPATKTAVKKGRSK